MTKKNTDPCCVCGEINTKLRHFKGSDETYCNKHYHQLLTHGTILERTRFTLNEFKIYDDYVEFLTYDIKGNIKGSFIVDLDDFEKVRYIKWSSDSDGYIRNGSDTDYVFIHRLIMGFPEDMQIDHWDMNKSNNRKSNLRIVNNQQNCMNKILYSHNKSGHRGVIWNKKNNNWNAIIGYNGKNIHLGTFYNFEDAVKARLDAELFYFGEYSPENRN